MALVKREDIATALDLALTDLEELERVGIIKRIDIGGNSYYSERNNLRIRLVVKPRKLGFSLREIKALIDAATVRNRGVNGTTQS